MMEVSSEHPWPANKFVRFFAHLASVFFHPIFIPVYVSCFLLYWHPLTFPGFSSTQKLTILVTVAINLTFFPAITVLLLWRLKFIRNIRLQTQRERIVPYAASMIFYFWGWYVFMNLPDIPIILKTFLSGAFFTVIAAWLANILMKVSMHALAVGGMVTFVTYTTFLYPGTNGLYLSAAILMAGVVCSARLIVSAHKGADVYLGLLIGGLCQALAAWL